MSCSVEERCSRPDSVANRLTTGNDGCSPTGKSCCHVTVRAAPVTWLDRHPPKPSERKTSALIGRCFGDSHWSVFLDRFFTHTHSGGMSRSNRGYSRPDTDDSHSASDTRRCFIPFWLRTLPNTHYRNEISVSWLNTALQSQAPKFECRALVGFFYGGLSPMFCRKFKAFLFNSMKNCMSIVWFVTLLR